MKRDISALSNGHFDHVIIGGGFMGRLLPMNWQPLDIKSP